MDFGGRYLFAAKRAEVWSALNSTKVLKAVIPGCESIVWTGPETLDLQIRVNLGLVKPVFAGELALSNVLPAQSYTLTGRGRGGMLGLAQGAADITLGESREGTVLDFTARGKADGAIMRLGKTIIGSSARKIIDGFFTAIGAQMGVSVVPLPRD
ncbi:MAG: SRPBCC domain-containing protein [Devosia sp.]